MISDNALSYHGAGKTTVRRSEIAIDMRTMLVGERMCFLLSTIIIRMLERKVTASCRSAARMNNRAQILVSVDNLDHCGVLKKRIIVLKALEFILIDFPIWA